MTRLPWVNSHVRLHSDFLWFSLSKTVFCCYLNVLFIFKNKPEQQHRLWSTEVVCHVTLYHVTWGRWPQGVWVSLFICVSCVSRFTPHEQSSAHLCARLTANNDFLRLFQFTWLFLLLIFTSLSQIFSSCYLSSDDTWRQVLFSFCF